MQRHADDLEQVLANCDSEELRTNIQRWKARQVIDLAYTCRDLDEVVMQLILSSWVDSPLSISCNTSATKLIWLGITWTIDCRARIFDLQTISSSLQQRLGTFVPIQTTSVVTQIYYFMWSRYRLIFIITFVSCQYIHVSMVFRNLSKVADVTCSIADEWRDQSSSTTMSTTIYRPQRNSNSGSYSTVIVLNPFKYWDWPLTALSAWSAASQNQYRSS